MKSNRRLSLAAFLLVLALAACGAPSPAVQPPEATSPFAPPTATDAPANLPATQTKIPLPTETPVPETPSGPRAIGPENAAQLAEQMTIGLGAIQATPLYSPEGRWLAVPTAAGIYLYDAKTYQALRKIPVGTAFIAFAPDGGLLAAGGPEAVSLWDPASGQRLGELRDQPGLYFWDLAFSPDGTWLAAVAWNNEVLVWSLSNAEMVYSFPGNRLEFSPDGRLAVVMDYNDHQAHLYQLENGEDLNQWPARYAGFAPGGQLWLDDGETVRLAYPERNLISAPFKGLQPAFSADGSLMALFDAGQVWLYDPGKGRRVRQLEGDYHGLDGLAFSPDGRTAAGNILSLHCPTCSEFDGLDRSLVIWRAADGAIVSQSEHPSGQVVFSPDSSSLAVSFSEYLQVIRSADGAVITRLDSFFAPVPGMALSSDGRTLAAVYATDPYALRLWDSSTGDAIRVLHGHENASAETNLAVAISQDGTHFGVRGDVWDLAVGKRLTSLELAIVEQTHCASSAMAFSPDGETLATGCYEGQLDLWSVSKGVFLQRIGGYTSWVDDLAYSPDGAHLAAVYGEPDHLVQIYRLPDGWPEAELAGGHYRRVAFSPDGRNLAAVAANPAYEQYGQPGGFVQLWRPWDDSQPTRLDVDDAVSVAFSPDGQWLATGSLDGSLRLWQLPAGRLVFETSAHLAAITRLAFTPEGDRLICASLDGTISAWGAP